MSQRWEVCDTMRDRRLVAAAVLPMLVAGALVTGACTHAKPDASATPSRPAPRPRPTPTTAPPPAPAPFHLGPAGFGALQLGMTRAQAQATGLTAGLTPSGKGSCGGAGDGYLAGAPTPTDTDTAGRLFFSATTGKLVAIYAYPGVATPQAVGPGTGRDQLRAAYPAWKPITEGATNGRGSVPAPGNTKAHYRIVMMGNKVVELSLDSNDQDCYE